MGGMVLETFRYESLPNLFFGCVISTSRGVTALTRAVSGEKQIYSGNLEILLGIGKPGKLFGKYEIFLGH